MGKRGKVDGRVSLLGSGKPPGLGFLKCRVEAVGFGVQGLERVMALLNTPVISTFAEGVSYPFAFMQSLESSAEASGLYGFGAKNLSTLPCPMVAQL